MKKYYMFLVILGLLFLSSCATIVKGGMSEVTIITEPRVMQVEIVELTSGIKIFSGDTPAQVTLSRSFRYGVGNEYSIILTEEGVNNEQEIITMRLIADEKNAWYTVGNIFSGLFLGWYFVDSVTGAMYSWSDVQIEEQVEGKQVVVEGAVRNRKHNKIRVILEDK